MRLPPRTPRGIWLLAAAIWAAACTVAWLVLPIRPRAEWATDSPMLPVGFVPGRRTLVCGTVLGGDAGRGETLGPLRFLDADSGQVGEWFEAGEEVRLRASAPSPDGRWAAVCHGRGGTFRLQLFDIATGQPWVNLPHRAGADLMGTCFSPDGQRLAYAEYGDDGGCIHVWDLTTGRECCTLRPAGGRIAFAPDGRTLATADAAGAGPWPDFPRVRLWDVESGRLVRVLDGPPSLGCGHVGFAPDGRHVTAVFLARNEHDFPSSGRWGYGDQVRCWDIAGGAETLRVGCNLVALPSSIPSLPEAEYQVALTSKPTTVLFRSAGNSTLTPDDPAWMELFAAGGRTLAIQTVQSANPVADWFAAHRLPWPSYSGGWVAHFRFVDIPSGRTIGRLPSHPTSGLDHHRLAWVHFSPDGELFAVAENDRLRVWDVPPRQPLALFLTLTAVLGAVVVGLARWRLCRQAAAAG